MIQTKKILKEAILICENIQSIGVFIYNQKYYVHNTFTTNYRWQIVICCIGNLSCEFQLKPMKIYHL